MLKIKTFPLAASLSASSFKQHSEPETFLLLNKDPGETKLLQINYISSFLHYTGNTKVQNTNSDLQINTSDWFRCIQSFLSPPPKLINFLNKSQANIDQSAVQLLHLTCRRHRPKLSAPLAFTPDVRLYPYIILPVLMILQSSIM